MTQALDRATLAARLAERLRSRGVAADLAGVERLVRAFEVLPPDSSSALYWAARLSLVHRAEDLVAFDSVFAAVVADAEEAAPTRQRLTAVPVRRQASLESTSAGVPWLTRRAAIRAVETSSEVAEHGVPTRLPTALAAVVDAPFGTLTPEQVDELGRWLAAAVRRRPVRRAPRRRPDRRGKGIALRATLARARRTGWEPVDLVSLRRVPKPRPIVMLCDVSRSMQAETTPLLHLMRALVVAADAEVFAFGTELTRLTRTLASSDGIDATGRRVADRFGGTRIAASLRAFLTSPHGDRARGAVVVVASDGWDSDSPQALADSMARLRRRAHRVVWVNPRAGVDGFEPRVATMAAALPYCDELLAAGSFADLRHVLDHVLDQVTGS